MKYSPSNITILQVPHQKLGEDMLDYITMQSLTSTYDELVNNLSGEWNIPEGDVKNILTEAGFVKGEQLIFEN